MKSLCFIKVYSFEHANLHNYLHIHPLPSDSHHSQSHFTVTTSKWYKTNKWSISIMTLFGPSACVELSLHLRNKITLTDTGFLLWEWWLVSWWYLAGVQTWCLHGRCPCYRAVHSIYWVIIYDGVSYGQARALSGWLLSWLWRTWLCQPLSAALVHRYRLQHNTAGTRYH